MAGDIIVRQYVPGQDDETWVSIYNRARAGEPEFVPFTVDQLERIRRSPWFKPDTRFIAELAGAPVGTVNAYLGDDKQMRVGDVTGLKVVPEARRRGVGSALLGRALASLRERGATGVEGGSWDHEAAGISFLRKHGFAPSHTYSWMDRPATPIPGDAAVCRRVTLREFGETDDEIATYHRLFESAYAEYHNHERLTPSDWTYFVRHQRDDGTIVERYFALDAGQPVGFVILAIDQRENEQLGTKRAWVYDIGVLKEHRGQGIGTRLLVHLIERAAADGMDSVILNVDDQNVTGARRVYERVGFRLVRQYLSFERSLVQPDSRPAG
jgi:ribosomal protein S18 acetylase RimI-like enzyme